jgi:hypothetical protein
MNSTRSDLMMKVGRTAVAVGMVVVGVAVMALPHDVPERYLHWPFLVLLWLLLLAQAPHLRPLLRMPLGKIFTEIRHAKEQEVSALQTVALYVAILAVTVTTFT